MPAIKDMPAISAKWRSRADQSTQHYRDGVLNTPKDWKSNTAAASASYKTGMQAALQANRWEKGVAKAGTEKWRANAANKGTDRWAQGIQLSGDAYAQGFAPFHSVIQATTLPPRGPRGSAENYNRSRVMGEALHNKRIGK